MTNNQIIRGAAHYNAVQAEAWKQIAREFADVLIDAAYALGASQPFSPTGNERHAQVLANINAALGKAEARGL